METVLHQITDSTMAISFTVGLLFVIVAIITLIFPPKKINYLYGYRTSASMKNQERWDFAQRFSGIKMVQSGLFLIAMSLLNIFMKLNEDLLLVINFLSIGFAVVFLYVSTERAIKHKFPKE